MTPQGQFAFPYAVNTHYISGPGQDMKLDDENYQNYLRAQQGGGGGLGSSLGQTAMNKAMAGQGAAAAGGKFAGKAAPAAGRSGSIGAIPTGTTAAGAATAAEAAGTAVGAQAAAGTAAGAGAGGGMTSLLSACCFIFLESYNGQLPPWVRYCRDTMCTPERVRGYNRMARWLVPMMRRYGWVKRAVNSFMVAPLSAYGGWLWREKGYEDGDKYAIVVRFWFLVWDIMGKVKNAST